MHLVPGAHLSLMTLGGTAPYLTAKEPGAQRGPATHSRLHSWARKPQESSPGLALAPLPSWACGPLSRSSALAGTSSVGSFQQLLQALPLKGTEKEGLVSKPGNQSALLKSASSWRVGDALLGAVNPLPSGPWCPQMKIQHRVLTVSHEALQGLASACSPHSSLLTQLRH